MCCFSVSEIVYDKEYSVEFPTKVGNLSLIVVLGPKFPLEKPTMKVCPRVSHNWVDSTGQVVLAPGLLNVSVTYLGFFKQKPFHLIYFAVHDPFRSGESRTGHTKRIRTRSVTDTG